MAKGSSNWIWWTIGGLSVVGLGFGAYIFFKDRKAKKEEKKAEVDTSPSTSYTPSYSAPTQSSESSQSSLPSTPFKNSSDGNNFRRWVNDTYPSYAKEIDLSKKSSKYNNETIKKAWAKYGSEYLKGGAITPNPSASQKIGQYDFDRLKRILEDGGKITDIKIEKDRVRAFALDGKGFGSNNIYVNFYADGYVYFETGSDADKKAGKWSTNGNALILEVQGNREEGMGSWAVYYMAKKLYPNVEEFTDFLYSGYAKFVDINDANL